MSPLEDLSNFSLPAGARLRLDLTNKIIIPNTWTPLTFEDNARKVNTFPEADGGTTNKVVTWNHTSHRVETLFTNEQNLFCQLCCSLSATSVVDRPVSILGTLLGLVPLEKEEQAGIWLRFRSGDSIVNPAVSFPLPESTRAVKVDSMSNAEDNSSFSHVQPLYASASLLPNGMAIDLKIEYPSSRTFLINEATLILFPLAQ